MLSLKAKVRDLKENLEEIRKAGDLPAVFYGAGKESTSISVSKIDFKKIWQKAGESSTVKIILPPKTATGKEEEVDVLIHEIQADPVTDEPIHVDFLAIDMTKKIKVDVPLEFVGISEAVKGGGILVKVLHEVEVEALPADLPHNLTVDISKLATLGSQIFVSDIKLSPGVTMITKGTEIVASVTEAKEEKEEAPPVDLSAIEVEKKGKKEEEAGSEGAGATEEKK